MWIKLGDFGICKRLTETTKPQTLLGTIRYLAPEVTRDIFANTGPRTHASAPYTTALDIWSVGIITHELLTKSHPFADHSELVNFGEGRIQLSAKSLKKGGVSAEAMLFVGRCLSARPSTRPTCRELLRDDWLNQGDPEDVAMTRQFLEHLDHRIRMHNHAS